MEKNTLNENLALLNELLRKVSTSLSPYGKEDKLFFLTDEKEKLTLQGKYPKCFLTIKGKGREIPFFPICNRMGIHDPDIIKFSIKLANELNGSEDVDQDDLGIILAKLERLHSTYSKEIVKPPDIAARKGFATRMFNNIKKHIEINRMS